MRKIADLDEGGRRHSAHFRPVESHGTTLPDCALAYDPNAWHRCGGGSIIPQGKYAARGGTMQVSEILKVKGNALFTIAPEGKLTEAVSVMAQHNMGSLVVIDKGRVVGMLTFKEVLIALDKSRGALDDARVRDTMEHDPVTASPAMEVNDLRRIMIESGARYLPVMDRDKLLGVISFRDVAKAVLEEQDFENRMLKGYIKNWPE
jgi:CBS domain-containing protein